MKSATWKLHEAKDHLSEVVERARRHGEQTITKHGKPVAVLMSVEHFHKLEGREEPPSPKGQPARGTGASLIALMQRCPAPEIFDIMEKERVKDRGRGLRDLELD
jgi:prevent-host-death family protein